MIEVGGSDIRIVVVQLLLVSLEVVSFRELLATRLT